jgi:HPt (histidine-containing phosphotransfer) domain-containing protein
MTKIMAGPGMNYLWAPVQERIETMLNLLNIEDIQMNTQETLLDPRVLQQLVKDIGLENTKKFMDSLDREFQIRIENLRSALAKKAFVQLSAEAHSLKSSALISGAYKLAEILEQIELKGKLNDTSAFALTQEAITTADLTRFAFLDVKLD